MVEGNQLVSWYRRQSFALKVYQCSLVNHLHKAKMKGDLDLILGVYRM